MKRSIAIIYAICLSPILLLGQSPSYDSLLDPGFTITARSQAGFIISHRENMSHLVKGHVGGFELNMDRQTSGTQSWHNSFNRPSVGLGFLYLGLGNPQFLGTGTALFGYIDFPFVKRKKFIFHYKFGTGIGNVSKPFDRVENYKNTAIGSAVNMFASVQFETKFKIGERFWFTSGLTFNHWSNASIAVPNLGINVPTLAFGVQGYFADYSMELSKTEVKKLPKTIEFIVYGVGGVREIHPVDGPLYGVLHGAVEATRRMDNKRKVGIGLDVFYDASNLEVNNRDTLNVPVESGSEFVKVGVHLSHELVFGRFSAIVQMGVYLRNNYESDGPIYHRMSYRYYVSKRFFVDAGFKSHWAVAENFEVGMGYKIK